MGYATKRRELQLLFLFDLGDWELREDGSVWTRRSRGQRGRWVRAEKAMPNGYLVLRAKVGAAVVYAYAHRVVWTRVNGPIPLGMTINHKNGVKQDNAPPNLECVSSSENHLHRYRVLGHRKRGGRPEVLTAELVTLLRSRVERGEPLAPIARALGLCYSTLWAAVRGPNWR